MGLLYILFAASCKSLIISKLKVLKIALHIKILRGMICLGSEEIITSLINITQQRNYENNWIKNLKVRKRIAKEA